MQQVHSHGYVRLRSSLLQPKDARGRAHSLWLSADHLLLVQTGSFVQTASRVDLRDIEAVTLRHTATYAWTNALAAVPCVVGACLMAATNAPWAIFGACLTAPCLLILLVNLLLGRTCECRLQTRVCTRTLHALCRSRYARRALPVLVRHIEATQTDLPPVAAALQQAVVAGPVPLTEPGPGLPRARHAVHALFYGLLDVQAITFLLVIRSTTVATLLLCACTAMVLTAVALFSAAFQHRVVVATRLRVVTWFATGCVVCGAVAGYFLFMFSILTQGLVDSGFSMSNQVDRLALRYARQLAQDGLSVGLHWALLAAAIAAALIALLGFAIFFTVPPALAAPRSPPRPTGPAAENP